MPAQESKNNSSDSLDNRKKELELEKLMLEKEKLTIEIKNAGRSWIANLFRNNLLAIISIVVACGTLFITFKEKIDIPNKKNRKLESIVLFQFLDTLNNAHLIPQEVLEIASNRPDLFEKMVEIYLMKKNENHKFLDILKVSLESNPEYEFISSFQNLYCAEKYTKFKNEDDHRNLNRIFFECFPSYEGKENYKMLIGEIKTNLLPNVTYLSDTLHWNNNK